MRAKLFVNRNSSGMLVFLAIFLMYSGGGEWDNPTINRMDGDMWQMRKEA